MSPEGLQELNRQLLIEIDRHRHIGRELMQYRVLKRRAELATPEQHAAIIADLLAVRD